MKPVPAAPPDPLAACVGLTLRRPGTSRDAALPLITRLDWRIAAGQRWAVIGRNAAGKSTLLRTLAGLQPPAEGQVLWSGRPASQWTLEEAAGHRAWMPQQAQDRFRLSVGRLLELARCTEDAEAATDALAQVDAAALWRRDVRTLSGGERQRVALAQVLCQGARLWLLDEPVAFQDPAHQAQVGQRLCDHVPAGSQRAIVFSAHDINWVAAVATHVLALHGDGAWHAGPAAAMLTAPMLRAIYGCPWQQAGGIWIPRV